MYGDNTSISGGADDYYIFNSSGTPNSTIFGDEGNDTVSNIGVNVFINGGKDDDSIDNRGANVTISGGVGNDYINNGYWNGLWSRKWREN